MRARGTLALAVLALGAACSEATFVSLGRNVSQAVTSADAAPPPEAGTGGASTDIDLEEEPLCVGQSPSVAVSSACATRTELRCSEADAGSAAQEALENALYDVLIGCGEIDNGVHVRFGAGGCAESFELLFASTAPNDARPCIAERLGRERYACAAPGSCGVGVVLSVPID